MLSDLTTAAVGGPAGNYIEARTEAEIIEAVRTADAAGEPLLIIGGGSNLLISDDGFPGTVVRIASEGFTVNAEDSCGGVALVVQAGHNWDALVQHAVLHAWSGIEALSGIPGATGATPVQNVGAYGVEVDNQGYVYLSGRSGPGFPTTAGVLQPTYQGHYTGTAYGDQNAFIAKLKPDGLNFTTKMSNQPLWVRW